MTLLYLRRPRVRTRSGKGDAAALVALVAGVVLDVGTSLIQLIDLGIALQTPLHHKLRKKNSVARFN